MSAKKLPDIITVNRLYWLEELSLTKIGAMYGVTEEAVRDYMKHNDIPRRPAVRKQVAQCIVCGQTVCLKKMWVRRYKVYRWRPTIYCLIHNQEKIRRCSREWKRRKFGIPAEKWKGPRKKQPIKMTWAKKI